MQCGRSLGYRVTCPVLIGDIVQITDESSVFPTFSRGFKWSWGGDADGFHNPHGLQIKEYYGVYGNYWKVLNFFIHYIHRYEVVVAIANRNNEKLLIECKGIKVIKRASPKLEQPNFIEKLLR